MADFIGVDARWVGNHGIGRYAAEVLPRIPEAVDMALDGSPTSAIEPMRLSLALQKENPKVFYTPGFNSPLIYHAECIVTIHDLIHLQDPHQKSTFKSLYYNKVLKRNIRKAPFLFTVSDQSKQQILEWAELKSSQVIVTPNGISEVFTPEPASEKMNSFLYVGSSRSHKNTVRMLKAFALLRDQDIGLQWVGPISNEDRQLIQKLNITRRVVFHSNISNDVLADLYRRCLGTILVSTLEGFGLPPMESVFCGTPAIISSASPLALDLQPVAKIVDPLNVEDIAYGLERLCITSYTSVELEWIKQLREKYNWTQTGEIVRENLKKLL